MHLPSHPFPHRDGEAALTDAVVIGWAIATAAMTGSGPAVAAMVAALELPGVRVLSYAAETTAIPMGRGPARRRGRCRDRPGNPGQAATSTISTTSVRSAHELSLQQTYALARALGRAPGAVVVVTVDVADTGHGWG